MAWMRVVYIFTFLHLCEDFLNLLGADGRSDAVVGPKIKLRISGS